MNFDLEREMAVAALTGVRLASPEEVIAHVLDFLAWALGDVHGYESEDLSRLVFYMRAAEWLAESWVAPVSTPPRLLDRFGNHQATLRRFAGPGFTGKRL